VVAILDTVSRRIAQLETRLKRYLGSETAPQGNLLAARLGSYVGLASYKRQYLGYTDHGKRLVLVNGFCEKYWKEDDPYSWRERLVIILDGGPCFFRLRYDPSTSQFDVLQG
jgi:hypothetical protein